MKKIITAILFILFGCSIYTQTIQQSISVVQNAKSVGGSFSIILQVKGTNLPEANTLGSATIDINYDNTKLSYVDADPWAFGIAEGYICTATNNTTFIRLGVFGLLVNSLSSGNPPGIDIGDDYDTWVQLNFTILSTSGTSNFSIKPNTNEIGIFENHSNNPRTGEINNIPLTAPEIENQPLPVELTTFSAKQEGEKISISWQTRTEVNNYGFEVERTSSLPSPYQGEGVTTGRDGRGWNKIGFVEGSGNSNSTKNYSFTDKNPKGGSKFQYRLKQIDTDGKYIYSNIEEVEYKPTKLELYQNYPNPFNPTTKIDFSLPQACNVTLKIFNTLGEEVATLFNGYMEAGIQTINFNAKNLPSGFYIYRLRTEKATIIKKMLFLK
jgi:hypothetical protein